MKRISGIVVLVAALAGIAVGASGASGATKCQAGFTESRSAAQLTVSGDTCANARKVAERAGAKAPIGCVKLLDRKGHIGFRKPCVQRRYSCAAVQTNKRRALRVTCTRGSGQIRFTY